MFANSVGVQWKINKWLFLWLCVFVVIGVVIGLMTAMNARIRVESISTNLLDSNLLRAVRPTASFGGMMIGRMWLFVVSFAIIFVVSLNRWTVFVVFPITAYHGFSIVINMYWVIARFGVPLGSVLLVTYLLILVAVLVLVLVATVYCMRICVPARSGGLRGAINWRCFGRDTLSFLCAITVVALVEYFLYWAILSKFVFVM